MELFFLAMLAALVSDNESEKQRQLTPRVPEPEPDLEERKAFFFWNYIHGTPSFRVQYWNSIQESAFLLGEIVCPEGHSLEEGDLSYIDGLWFMLSAIKRTPTGPGAAPVDTRELEPLEPETIASTLWCHHREHKGPPGSTVPEHVEDWIERTWNEG